MIQIDLVFEIPWVGPSNKDEYTFQKQQLSITYWQLASTFRSICSGFWCQVVTDMMNGSLKPKSSQTVHVNWYYYQILIAPTIQFLVYKGLIKVHFKFIIFCINYIIRNYGTIGSSWDKMCIHNLSVQNVVYFLWYKSPFCRLIYSWWMVNRESAWISKRNFFLKVVSTFRAYASPKKGRV